MRHEFVANSVRGSNSNSDATSNHRSEGQKHDSHQHPSARQILPKPASLAKVMLSARQLLIDLATECLSAGTSFSGFSMGTIHPGQGPTMSLGPGILSRNIDITIRRGQATGNADGTPQADGFQQLENMDGARNSVVKSVHEVLQAGRASAGREHTVRFVSIRTVIAIPSSSHRPSNSSGESDASLHSLFGRLQQQILGT